jgi:hypothetical protein
VLSKRRISLALTEIPATWAPVRSRRRMGHFRFSPCDSGAGTQKRGEASPGFIDRVHSDSAERTSDRFCKKPMNFTGACQAKTHDFSTEIHDVRHQQIKRRIGRNERVEVGDFAILPDKGSNVPGSPVD